MKYTFKFPISLAAVTQRVDAEKGIIYGVSIIAAGPALGHKVLCDQTSLEQLHALAKNKKNGLPVKFNIDTQDHNEGKGMNCGRIPADSLRIENGKLLGDVHLMKAAPCREYLIELANTQPENFGLSIEATGKPEEKDGMRLARFTELAAATFVDMPAANPTGLFSAETEEGDPKNTSNDQDINDMDLAKVTELIKAAVGESLKPMSDRMAKLEEGYTKLSKATEPDKDLPSEADVNAAAKEEKMAADCKDGDTMPVMQQKLKAYRQLLSQPATVGNMLVLLSKAGSTGFAKANTSGAGENPNKDTENDPIQIYRKAVIALKEKGVDEAAAVMAVNKQPDIYSNFCKAKDAAVVAKTYQPITF